MSFQYNDPYPSKFDAIIEEEDSGFDIDSDISDLDAQDLLKELKQLELPDLQRQLADATKATQERIWKNWSKFAQSVHHDPEKLLRKDDAKVFIGFLLWYRKNHPRSNRLTSYEGLWKSTRQLYYDRNKRVVPDEVGKPVTMYLQTTFCQKFSLVRGTKQNYTVGHHTLLGMIHHHWTFDESLFPIERERVQLVTVLLFLAYTGARPGSIVESSTTGLRGSGQAMLYRDLKLKLLQPPDGSSLLVLEVTIRLEKGKRTRPSPKTITLYENKQCPAMCPIIHFLALAFADDAFHPDLRDLGLKPANLHSFENVEGRLTIEYKFRDDILDVPLFRSWHSTLDGVRTHPTKPLSAGAIHREAKRLGEQAGLPHPFRMYCLRREVGTELTDQGVSDQQRNQILGHARSETFLKHYISSNIIVDVQATFLGRESKSDLIKEMGKLALRRDPKLPKELSSAQKRSAHQKEDLLQAQAKYEELGRKFKKKYHRINNAPVEDRRSRASLRTRINTLKSKYERAAFQELLKNFHSNADLEHMVLQLKGEKPMKQSMLEPTQYALPERNTLADCLFMPADSDSFARIVEAMTRLCKLNEPKSNKEEVTYPSVQTNDDFTGAVGTTLSAFFESKSQLDGMNSVESLYTNQPGVPPSDIELSTVGSSTEFLSSTNFGLGLPGSSSQSLTSGPHHKHDHSPIERPERGENLLPRNVCLFCYSPSARNHIYNRKDHLRRHYRTMHFQHQVGPFWCPVPGCSKLIQDPDHFCTHATSIHRSDLGVRASIMKENAHKRKPGQLQSFRLG